MRLRNPLLFILLVIAPTQWACGPARRWCENAECFVANVCRASCAAPETTSGCCPCPEGTFANLVCLPDGGQVDAGQVDGGAVDGGP